MSIFSMNCTFLVDPSPRMILNLGGGGGGSSVVD